MRRFGLLVIGDEILSGKRADQHFPCLVRLLAERGWELSWAEYHGDDRTQLTEVFRRTWAQGDVVFSCGGIGATPDDHTRQAAAAACGLPLVLHPEAARLITLRTALMAGKPPEAMDMSLPENQQRLQMGMFPQGCTLVPNPVNGIPGFAFRDHVFVPGFPAMAGPMMAWALDRLYPDMPSSRRVERGVQVFGLSEAAVTPLLESIESEFAPVKTYSLPTLPKKDGAGVQTLRFQMELGVKGTGHSVEPAFQALLKGVEQLGGQWAELEGKALESGKEKGPLA